jgi:enoyl-[acyl-carrier protein] reductase I
VTISATSQGSKPSRARNRRRQSDVGATTDLALKKSLTSVGQAAPVSHPAADVDPLDRMLKGVEGRPMGTDLKGRKGLVIGVANEMSIAYGCARAFHAAGAELALTYLDDRAGPHVRPLAEELSCPIVMACDVERPGALEAVFARLGRDWGRLDFALHSIAFAPAADLHGRVIECSAEGFARAMDISVHSFIRMARLAEPLMAAGGVLLSMSYYGAEKVVDHYNLMGPVKAALEAATRYMAAELGVRGIRVNCLSPGPLKTRAASGIAHFDDLMEKAAAKAPEHRLVTIEDVGAMAGFLVGDSARAVTGDVIYVDGGYHVVD